MARNGNIANTYYDIKMKERCAQSFEMIFFGGRVDFRKSGCAQERYHVAMTSFVWTRLGRSLFIRQSRRGSSPAA